MAGEMRFEEQTQRRWPDPDSGPWLLTIYWARRNGRPVQAGMKLVPMSEHAGEDLTLTTSVVRELRLAEVVIEDREQLKHELPKKPAPHLHVAGMRPSTVKRLHRAADIYLGAWHSGKPPRLAVARHMNITEAAAANLIRRAREAGFLPPTKTGVPQG